MMERKSIRTITLPPLHAAAMNKDTGALTQLLKSPETRQSINTPEPSTGCSALHCASSAEIVRILVNAGASPTARDYAGRTPVHTAAERDADDVVREVLSSANAADLNRFGCERLVDIRDIAGNTALHIAASRQSLEVCNALAFFKPNTRITNGHRQTALHIAAGGHNPAIVSLILELGADVSAADNDGLTPLHVAARSDFAGWEICGILCDNGADINAVDVNGSRPLDLALVAEQVKKAGFLSSLNNTAPKDGIIPSSIPAGIVPVKCTTPTRATDKADEMLKRSLEDVAVKENVVYDEWGFVVNSSEASSMPETSRSEKQERQCAAKWMSFFTKDPKDWERAQKKNANKIRDMVYHGIPRSVRGQVWLAIMGADKLKASYAADFYQQLLANHSSCMEEIDKDISRTFRAHELFAIQYGDGQKMLQNILRAYSIFDAGVGYCQGMSEVCAVWVMNMSEVDVFFSLVQFMSDQKYAMRELFLPDMAAVNLYFHVLSRLVEEHLPKLHDHFEEAGVKPCFFATKWFMTMFSGVLPFEFMLRIWDIIIYEGSEMLFTVSLRILELLQKRLLSMSFEEIIQNLLSLKYIHQCVDSVDAFVSAVTRHPISHSEIVQLKLELKVDSKSTPSLPYAKSTSSKPSSSPSSINAVNTSLDDNITPLAQSSSTLLNPSPSGSPGPTNQKDASPVGITMMPPPFDSSAQSRSLAQSAPLMVRSQPDSTSTSPGSPCLNNSGISSNGSGTSVSPPVVFSLPPLQSGTPTVIPQPLSWNPAAAAVAATTMPATAPTQRYGSASLISIAQTQSPPTTATPSTPTGSAGSTGSTAPQQTTPVIRSPSSAVLLGRIKFS